MSKSTMTRREAEAMQALEARRAMRVGGGRFVAFVQTVGYPRA